MNFKLEYDHRHLSMVQLHNIGVRSTKELEEVIEGFSICEENSYLDEFPLFIFTGFTFLSKGLKIALTISEEGKYVTLDVIVPSPEELLKKLCLLTK